MAASNDKKVTEAAEKKAKDAGVDPQHVEGTGSGGQVTADDVSLAVDSGQTLAARSQALAEAQHTGDRMPNLTKAQARTLGADVEVEVNPDLGSNKATFPVYPLTGEKRTFIGSSFLGADEWDVMKNHPTNYAEGGKKILVRKGGV